MLVMCSQCSQPTNWLIEGMCGKCYDEAMKGLQPSCEAWFERLHRQIDDILTEIQKINVQLSVQLSGKE
uniref:Uncharacterized protein n=1 Tax=viral metagenome TaxID=1070528 RepID=A0A6M3LSK2_9ZZZZ